MPLAVRGFLPDEPATRRRRTSGRDGEPAARGALRGVAERRTLLIGVFVLAFAFAEGTGNDWIGVASSTGTARPAAVGTLGVRRVPRPR